MDINLNFEEVQKIIKRHIEATMPYYSREKYSISVNLATYEADGKILIKITENIEDIRDKMPNLQPTDNKEQNAMSPRAGDMAKSHDMDIDDG